MAIQYSGGTYINTTFLGDTKTDIITALQTQLTAAGWTVVSGSGTTNLLMQTAQASGSNNQGRVRFKDNGGACVQVTIENVSGSAAQTQDANHGGNLIPGASLTYRVIASKFQFFCFVPGSSNTSRRFVCAGITAIPSFLQGVITENIYLQCDSDNDTDTSTRASFRTCLGSSEDTYGSGAGNNASIVNGSLRDSSNQYGQTNLGDLQLVVPGSTQSRSGVTPANAYRWHDLSVQISEPLLAHGTANVSDEAIIRGQLYDCCVMSDAFAIDTTTSFADQGATHAFWGITALNAGLTGSPTVARGSLFVATS